MFVRIAFILMLTWQTGIEISQMQKEGLLQYLRDINILDDLVIIVNGVTLFLHATDAISHTLLRQFGAVGLCLVWYQGFYWFRLFDGLARYVDLIGATISDIAKFMLVFFELFVLFALVFYMLQISRVEQGSTLYTYNEETETPAYLWYAFLHQFYLTLGDFSHTYLNRNYEDFSGEESFFVQIENFLVIFFFLASVFIGQVVIFNMLIAVMAQTYSENCETLDESGKRQKLKLVSEYSDLVVKLSQCC